MNKLLKRILVAAALTIIGFAIAAILQAISGQAAVMWAIGAYIAGIVAIAYGNVQWGVVNALALGLFAPITLVASTSPVASTALMALMCLSVGRLAQYNLQRSAILIPIFMAWLMLGTPEWQGSVQPANPEFLMWMAVSFFIGAIIPVLILPSVLKRSHITISKQHSFSESLIYTVTIMVLTSGSVWVLMKEPGHPNGAWLITTILVLVQVGGEGTIKKTFNRVGGTLLGVIVAGVIVMLSPPPVALVIIGSVFAIAALTAMFGSRYWLYVSFLTPALLCLEASSTKQVIELGERRLFDTVVGAILVLVAVGIAIAGTKLHTLGAHKK